MGKNNKLSENTKKLSGKEGFEQFYGEIFHERWSDIKSSFYKENVYAEIFSEGKESYFLDPASVMAASLLPLENAVNILDLCAAPGGKTLVLAHRMRKDAVLVSNERSASRKQRLLQTCDNCLDEQIRARIKISCSDGSKWCTTQKEVYDSILLDAPCSSERHVFLDEKYLNEWSKSRIKTLCFEQWALLSSAYRLLVPGGYLLYSTCALCPQENDENIKRLLKKFDDASLVYKDKNPVFNNDVFSFCKTNIIPECERTEFGFHILPDKQAGSGPIWFTLIKKNEKSSF